MLFEGWKKNKLINIDPGLKVFLSMTLCMGNIDVVAYQFLKIYFVDTSGPIQHDLEA